ncbi:OmpA family protein [bacterium]|nr:OmpA family protein [bacterium]
MKKTALTFRILFTLLLIIPQFIFAQDDLPSPKAGPDSDNPTVIPTGLEENKEEVLKSKSRTTDVITGTGILMIAPQIEVGFLTATPRSANIFSKLETKATGWVVEPKFGVGIFSKKIALDLLAGAQLSSLTGKRIGKADSFIDESPSASVTALDEPYTLSQTTPMVEGDARIRVGKGNFQIGIAASALFGTSQALYSSVPDVGSNYAVFAGPQIVYEERVLESIFRFMSSLQFMTTGNQRSAFSARVGACYSFLVNSPFLKVTETSVVKSKTQIQKKIVTIREQSVVENENVSFIFDSQMINFKFNSADLTDRSKAFVSGLGQIFSAQHSDWQKLTVEGHTDSKGNTQYNKKLSQRRAETVKSVLVESGIPDGDIEAIGYGKERLMINPEKSEIDYARNRRVEIKLKGLRDARILQRSITRLEKEIFGRNTGANKSEGESKGEDK